MMQPTQQSLVKIDALISGIRMINLHVFNYLSEHSNPRGRDSKQAQTRDKQIQQFKKMNLAHFQEHMKFINEYLRKCLKDMAKTKISLSPLVYRSIRNKILTDEDFLRFQSHNYGVKFIFIDLLKECLMNIEIYRKVQGTRIGGIAMRKLQMTFLYDLSSRYPQGQFTADLLESQGKDILAEVNIIFGGQKCANCNKHLVLNNEIMAFLPPTIRECSETREGRKERKYYHESCL